MTDVHSPETRSYNMSRIRSRDTKPELLVRHFLFSKGFRYRLHAKNLPSKPDIVLPKYRTVIFVNGCFWHEHKNCKYYVIPKTRTMFWLSKISNNIQNDHHNYIKLKKLGWFVITVFECQLKPKAADRKLRQILTCILMHQKL